MRQVFSDENVRTGAEGRSTVGGRNTMGPDEKLTQEHESRGVRLRCGPEKKHRQRLRLKSRSELDGKGLTGAEGFGPNLWTMRIC